MVTLTLIGAVISTQDGPSTDVIVMAGGPVSWLSKLQFITTVSSMEAEYVALFFLIQNLV